VLGMIGRQSPVLLNMLNSEQWKMDGHHGMEHQSNKIVPRMIACGNLIFSFPRPERKKLN